ncbi:mandelate racemase/muconate lactonizing enzyme family protein [Micromonospora carbonacea]|jgi:galactonate dehydratase|uniref:mandelate racemase/muconate lactonizing enzyme family protein n=1 Tax=Micromonospora TaxID=1873 RepID=UPI0024159FD0|nr:mandelate racemase/muconate lactonizing enzyme family protein [Micromonospora sp. WMMD956]MDG4819046.1 mandelate racemase/muconate lactonizing enzyme family protein [Micromonospora sp. WMMD956]
MEIVEVESAVRGDAHFVQVHTADGLTGVGQSACWGYPTAVHAVVEAFRPYLIGADAGRIEHHWHHLYRMGPFRGSVLTAAVSAVDLALWDLLGKRLGVPVWQLLGGRVRERIRLHLLLGGTGAPALAAEAAAAVADGFTAVKFDPLPANYGDLSQARLVAETEATTAAVRDTVGADVDLLIELHRKLTPLQAEAVVPALARHHPLMVEDAIQIDSVSSQAGVLRRAPGVPMANGERLHTIWEFKELLAQGGAQYVRPDVGLAGGLSHARKIAALAEAHHAAVVTHNCLGPLLTMASVHLDTVIPNFVTQEYSPLDDALADGPARACVRREGGFLPVPQDPGLGVTLDLSDPTPLDLTGRPLTRIPLRADGSVAYAV